jgi:hypothetical protein
MGSGVVHLGLNLGGMPFSSPMAQFGITDICQTGRHMSFDTVWLCPASSAVTQQQQKAHHPAGKRNYFSQRTIGPNRHVAVASW